MVFICLKQSLLMTSKTAAMKGVSRIDEAVADRLFPLRRQRWPTGYLPAKGVAHFLRMEGVAFHDIVTARREIKDDDKNVIQRDFAADYSLWLKCTLDDHINNHTNSDSGWVKLFKRFSNRERAIELDEVCRLWGLQLPSSVLPTAAEVAARELAKQPKGVTTKVLVTGTPYHWTTFAHAQTVAARPIEECTSPDSKVHFETFPALQNCLYLDFDSCSPMKAISLISGDGLLYSQEFILAVASYLRQRLEELGDDALTGSRNADGTLEYRPILSTFGNGRLAYLLNDSQLLPAKVVATRVPKPLIRRRLQYKFRDGLASARFNTNFACEVLDVAQALAQYEPCVVLVEPHADRDYISDLRGYHTVREVLTMGQVDSPAMGSFTYPLLSFGVIPGPGTYWVFNESMRRCGAMRGENLPMDPPHVAQGYERVFVDDISKTMVHPNDVFSVQNQSRALAFRRVEKPHIKEKR